MKVITPVTGESPLRTAIACCAGRRVSSVAVGNGMGRNGNGGIGEIGKGSVRVRIKEMRAHSVTKEKSI